MLVAGATWLGAPACADAFCGFYVSGGDAPLYNEATVVVLAREGRRTVISMQNNYEGPPQDFAMVVPVPVVLGEEDVRTLPREVFDDIGTMTAPRLVEYWEQDPCYEPRKEARKDDKKDADKAMTASASVVDEAQVVVEAQFVVGEYEVVILGASDSHALDAWLRAHDYRIPEGAAEVLRPYVAEGMKFFVAKVDATKVKFEDGRARLSPLRFHYDSDTFRLPIRLGMLNAKDEQDLIVNILSPRQRYEVANRDNITIPTNLDVDESVKQDFAGFYGALFDRVMEEHPGAVVTEYAWQATTCDPCPGPPLSREALVTAGGDLLPSGTDSLVLTRLHARYDASDPGEDLVFEKAEPIMGGNEWPEDDGSLSTTSQAAGTNMFQARYAVRHGWTGAVDCENPRFGVWTGPPRGQEPLAATEVALDTEPGDAAALVADALSREPGRGSSRKERQEPLRPILGLGLIAAIVGIGIAVHRKGAA